MVALLYSMEFLLSISMIGLISCAIFEWKNRRLGIRTKFKENVQKFTKNKAWLAITIPFFLVLFTAPYSTEDFPYLLERFRVKLPFLVLPFAFFSIPTFTKRAYLHIAYFFLILLMITSIGVLSNYLLHFQEINHLISLGQPIPTPSSHIRFSLMVALGILLGFSLFRKEHYFKFAWEKWLILMATLFLLAFIHILSVRSGLAVFYLSFFILLARYIFLSKRYITGLLVGLFLLSLPVGAYYTLPSFKTKVEYMKWDMKMHAVGKGESYSDSERINSLLAAKSIIEKHPILGVGSGDLKFRMKQQYQILYPSLGEDSRKMPHNQLVSVWAGTGLFGLFLFVLGGIYPLLSKKRYNEPHFLSICLIILFSFMVENTIENAIGIGFHLLFLLIGMNYLKGKD
jgi:O-antigen ligase